MKPAIMLVSAVAAALALGACASSDKSETASVNAQKRSGEQSRPWWKIPDKWKKKTFDPWVYGDVRKGPGLLSNDEEGFVIYSEPERGSTDPSKPEKVKR